MNDSLTRLASLNQTISALSKTAVEPFEEGILGMYHSNALVNMLVMVLISQYETLEQLNFSEKVKMDEGSRMLVEMQMMTINMTLLKVTGKTMKQIRQDNANLVKEIDGD